MMFSALVLVAAVADITLSGVVLAKSGRHAATLASEGRLTSVLAGERAFGCEVAAIRADQVDLNCAGGRSTLKLLAAGPEKAPQHAVEVPPAPQDILTGTTFVRADLEARLDREMGRLMTETTLVPVTSRGQVAGFTLTRIPEGTILESLGLRPGDVLTNVNDTPIDSFTTLVGLWPRLQSTGSVRAQILRDGKPMDISVNIR